MRKTTFIFAGIMSAIIGNAYATGENTVTSKSYVDAQDALKQDKISAGTTGSVVTYDGEDANGQAQFNERGIFDGSTEYSEQDNANDLVTADAIRKVVPTITTSKLVCMNDPDCTLWRISDEAVLQGLQCRIAADCQCEGSGTPSCVDGWCVCSWS